MMRLIFALLQDMEVAVEYDRLDIIDEYINVFVDIWNCKIDHEDGSTAPFSSIAMEVACSQLYE